MLASSSNAGRKNTIGASGPGVAERDAGRMGDRANQDANMVR
jgi:hypothetical protein